MRKYFSWLNKQVGLFYSEKKYNCSNQQHVHAASKCLILQTANQHTRRRQFKIVLQSLNMETWRRENSFLASKIFFQYFENFEININQIHQLTFININ